MNITHPSIRNYIRLKICGELNGNKFKKKKNDTYKFSGY